ncbi:MAG: hypothetical protein HY906_16820 [Deltaproteobacteria bacterium]|nr:hypothetical protein [Deltaproteobacteria bacterium]
MTRSRIALLVLAGAVMALQGPACSTRECGQGTVEKNGDCVAVDIGGRECGVGTHLEPSTLLCVPDQYTCDPDTAYVDDGGVCMGRVTGSLPPPPPCPAIAADEICVNGWLRDFDNQGKSPFSKDTLITDDSVEIWVFDPFVVLLCSATPCFDTTQAIAGPFYANADGTYLLFEDQAAPPRRIKATGSYIAIGLMNKGGGDPVGDRDWGGHGVNGAGITAAGQPGTVEEFDIYAVSKAQTDAWEATAPGSVAQGIFLTMWHYLDEAQADLAKNRTFVPGVLPNRSPSAIDITTLYFLTDDRSTLVQGSGSGVSLTTDVGGVLFVKESLGPHSATGGNVPDSDPPEAIDWESRLGASVPGLVFLQFFNQKL